jgi:hypothetical protein
MLSSHQNKVNSFQQPTPRAPTKQKEEGVKQTQQNQQIRPTCLTFAEIHKVSGEVTLFAIKLQTFIEKAKIPLNNKTCGAAEDAIDVQLVAICVISPLKPANKRHCINAKGHILLNRSISCIFKSPVRISPPITTFNEARSTQRNV